MYSHWNIYIFWAYPMAEIQGRANLCSCKISNNTRQAALGGEGGIHIVNQHNVCTHVHRSTHTRHLIIIILVEKGRVRDQLCPNPRMHCTRVSATSISFCFFCFPSARCNLPRGWFHSKRKEKRGGFSATQHYLSRCPEVYSTWRKNKFVTG